MWMPAIYFYALQNEKAIPKREKNTDESFNTNNQRHHVPHFGGENKWRLYNKAMQCGNFRPKGVDDWCNKQVCQ